MAGRFIAVNPTVASPRPFTLIDQGRLKTLFTSLNERCSRRLNSPIRRAPTVSACQFPLRWGGPVRLVGIVLPSDAYRSFLSCAGEMRRVRIAAISRAHRHPPRSRLRVGILRLEHDLFAYAGMGECVHQGGRLRGSR